MPLQGAGSPDVLIGNMKAWRAMPDGVGAGLEEASQDAKAVMDVRPTPAEAFAPPAVIPKAAKIEITMTKVAGQVEAELKTPGASAAVATAFATLKVTTATLTAAYTAAAAAPGGEPGARVAFTTGYQIALSAAMSSAVSAMAGPWDMHACAQSTPAPHGPGMVMQGCKTVFINNLPAVMKGQKVQEAAGGPTGVVMGCDTVIIGDRAPGGSETSAKSGSESALAPGKTTVGKGQTARKGSPAPSSSSRAPSTAAGNSARKEIVLFDLWVRLHIDPKQAASVSDVFHLTSSDGAISKKKSVSDDQNSHDDCVDLCFEQLDLDKSYSLQVIDEDGKRFIFEKVSGTDLHGDWAAASSGANTSSGEA
jgi:hypothetical protein